MARAGRRGAQPARARARGCTAPSWTAPACARLRRDAPRRWPGPSTASGDAGARTAASARPTPRKCISTSARRASPLRCSRRLAASTRAPRRTSDAGSTRRCWRFYFDAAALRAPARDRSATTRHRSRSTRHAERRRGVDAGASATSCRRPSCSARFADGSTQRCCSRPRSRRSHFHRDMLGLPADTAWLDVDSPFAAEQLTVRIARHISTRYRDRAALAGADRRPDGPPVRGGTRQLPGLLQQLRLPGAGGGLLRRAPSGHADVAAVTRHGRRASATRSSSASRDDSRGIGFAVLGGAFGEGIDLPGRRLIGAFIATLGLPPPDRLNEQLRQRMRSRLRRRLRLRLSLSRASRRWCRRPAG